METILKQCADPQKNAMKLSDLDDAELLEAATPIMNNLMDASTRIDYEKSRCRLSPRRDMLRVLTARAVVIGLNSGIAVAGEGEAAAVLSKESLDLDLTQFGPEPDAVPPGLVPSKTCEGLNLSDGDVDSAHIYWDARSGHFRNWVL
jgi:hypothetical protein